MIQRPTQEFPRFTTCEEYRGYIATLVIPASYPSFSGNETLEGLVGSNQTVERLQQAFRTANDHGVFVGPCINPAPDSFCALYRCASLPPVPEQDFA